MGDYFDPWATALNVRNADTSRMMADIAAEEEKRKKAEYDYQMETRKGLGQFDKFGSEMVPSTVEKVNPQYAQNLAAYETAQMPPQPMQKVPYGGLNAESLFSAIPEPATTDEDVTRNMVGQQGLGKVYAQDLVDESGIKPSITEQTQVPRYDRDEILRKKADYLASRGDWTGMKGLENAIDLSSKIDKRHQEIMKGISEAMSARRKAGWDLESNKAMTKREIEYLNRSRGQMMMDPSEVDKISFNDADLVTYDLGGGERLAMVTQPDGTVKPVKFNVESNSIARMKAENQAKNVSNQEEANRIKWAKLNPRLMRDLEASQASGKELGKDVVKGLDDYYNAQDSLNLLKTAEDLFNKDPNNIAGWGAKIRGTLGRIDPALEAALNAGDRNTFTRIMMNNADTFKKLLGPQISNSDADLMFKLSGATASSAAEIRAAFYTLKKRNQDTIKRHEQKAGLLTGVSPMAGEAAGGAPLTPYSGFSPGVNQGQPAAAPVNKPMTREAIQAIVKNFAKEMKPGETKKVEFNGRRGTVTRDTKGKVTVTLD